jgi:cytochrome c oxidase subunit 1
MMNETLGKIHFWGTVVSFNFIFIPLFILGAAGQNRRVYDFSLYPELATSGLQDLRIIATVALCVMLAFQVFFFTNFIHSLRKGPRAEKNPWKANSLEWTTDSPPRHGNWPESQMPDCYRGPYEYSVPGRDKDYWPQNEPA